MKPYLITREVVKRFETKFDIVLYLNAGYGKLERLTGLTEGSNLENGLMLTELLT